MKNNKKYEKKKEAGGAFFIFHQITDELSTIALHPLAYNGDV